MEEVRPLNVLLDINVPLDVLLDRRPWVAEAQAIWAAHHDRRIRGHLAAHGLTNLYYIARRVIGSEEARKAVGLCLETFDVIAVGRDQLEMAHSLPGSDFEDNLVMACASFAKLDAIVTRDPKGFAGSPVLALPPGEFLARVAGETTG